MQFTRQESSAKKLQSDIHSFRVVLKRGYKKNEVVSDKFFEQVRKTRIMPSLFLLRAPCCV